MVRNYGPRSVALLVSLPAISLWTGVLKCSAMNMPKSSSGSSTTVSPPTNIVVLEEEDESKHNIVVRSENEDDLVSLSVESDGAVGAGKSTDGMSKMIRGIDSLEEVEEEIFEDKEGVSIAADGSLVKARRVQSAGDGHGDPKYGEGLAFTQDVASLDSEAKHVDQAPTLAAPVAPVAPEVPVGDPAAAAAAAAAAVGEAFAQDMASLDSEAQSADLPPTVALVARVVPASAAAPVLPAAVSPGAVVPPVAAPAAPVAAAPEPEGGHSLLWWLFVTCVVFTCIVPVGVYLVHTKLGLERKGRGVVMKPLSAEVSRVSSLAASSESESEPNGFLSMFAKATTPSETPVAPADAGSSNETYASRYTRRQSRKPSSDGDASLGVGVGRTPSMSRYQQRQTARKKTEDVHFGAVLSIEADASGGQSGLSASNRALGKRVTLDSQKPSVETVESERVKI